ncbi:MAG: HEAT repeat domain-containing protein [Bacteroidota bacterium]
MKTHQCISRFFILVFCFMFYGTSLHTQTVIHYPKTDESLDQRWKWAIAEAGKRGLSQPYWIGYSFKKFMARNSFTGSFYSDERRNKPALCEILGLQPCFKEKPILNMGHHETMSGNITRCDNSNNSEQEIVKDIGVLFEVDHSKKGSELITDMKTSNLSLYVDLNDETVLWLGEADDSASIGFLQSEYDQHQPEEIQKKIISVVGLHPPTKIAITFLSRILKEGNRTEVRKDAAFWLGQLDSDEALDVLTETATNDESDEVMESAVFAISQMHSDKSTETLISLARTGKDEEMRKKAMFWLAQKASKKATATIEEIANDNDNEEIQKNAVFALTQLSDNEGVEPLIKIAKTHANPEVRKSAIFWLGQSEDKRALDALIEIIHN